MFALLPTAWSRCGCAAEALYPQRPIRFVIPQSPGGASDTVGRVVAQKLSDSLGQPFVIDNRPGATGNVGAELVKKDRKSTRLNSSHT